MDFDQLTYLIAVEKHGSISGASKQTHITQPSLSRSLKRLEKELGHELFEHGSNKVQFNEAGRIALSYAKEILNITDRMNRELAELDRKSRTLKVGSIAPAPTWHLTARIIERFPGTILASEMMDEVLIEPALLDHEIDLAITRKPSPLPNVISMPLMVEHLYLAAPSSSSLAKKEWVTWEDLDGKTFLLYEQIGFWHELVNEKLPHADFVLQKDREVFLQMVQGSDLLAFTTDAPQNRGFSKDRIPIPIRDASAHVTFYVNAVENAPETVTDIIGWLKEKDKGLT